MAANRDFGPIRMRGHWAAAGQTGSVRRGNTKALLTPVAKSNLENWNAMPWPARHSSPPIKAPMSMPKENIPVSDVETTGVSFGGSRSPEILP